jgi:hypothetical protein
MLKNLLYDDPIIDILKLIKMYKIKNINQNLLKEKK